MECIVVFLIIAIICLIVVINLRDYPAVGKTFKINGQLCNVANHKSGSKYHTSCYEVVIIGNGENLQPITVYIPDDTIEAAYKAYISKVER
jgi:hypothetical protein